MKSIFASLRLQITVKHARAFLLFCLALLSWAVTTVSFAGQFSQLAHAKYMFIGVVTEAKAEAVIKATIGDAAGSKHSVRKGYYVKASVALQQILTDAPKSAMANQSLSICTGSISVGATYLFILDEPEEKGGCYYSVPFLLGVLPGKLPESSIILTEDTLFMMPESPDLEQRAIALPDANVRESFCKSNVVILNTYLDLHDFLNLLKREKAKVGTPAN